MPKNKFPDFPSDSRFVYDCIMLLLEDRSLPVIAISSFYCEKNSKYINTKMAELHKRGYVEISTCLGIRYWKSSDQKYPFSYSKKDIADFVAKRMSTTVFDGIKIRVAAE